MTFAVLQKPENVVIMLAAYVLLLSGTGTPSVLASARQRKTCAIRTSITILLVLGLHVPQPAANPTQQYV